MTTVVTPIPARLKNVSHNDPYVAGVEDIIDDNKHKNQSEINTEYDNILSERVADKPATTGTTGDYPYNGMGRVELAMNMVNGVNTLTQDMFYKGAVGSRVPNTNTIFVIQYDYVLGEDITVPANCVLEFDGGSLNGQNSITFTNTFLSGEINITTPLLGTIQNNEINVTQFGAVGDGVTDNSDAISRLISFLYQSYAQFAQQSLYFPKGVYNITKDNIFGDTSVNHNFFLTIKGDNFGLARIMLITNGTTEKWFYKSSGNGGKMAQLRCYNIDFATDNIFYGNGFSSIGTNIDGHEKHYLFEKCEFELGVVSEFNGDAMADLNIFNECYIRCLTVMHLNNHQSVTNRFTNCYLLGVYDLFDIDEGGDIFLSQCEIEMHRFTYTAYGQVNVYENATDNNQYFVFKTKGSAGQAHSTLNISNCRMELHDHSGLCSIGMGYSCRIDNVNIANTPTDNLLLSDIRWGANLTLNRCTIYREGIFGIGQLRADNPTYWGYLDMPTLLLRDCNIDRNSETDIVSIKDESVRVQLSGCYNNTVGDDRTINNEINFDYVTRITGRGQRIPFVEKTILAPHRDNVSSFELEGGNLSFECVLPDNNILTRIVWDPEGSNDGHSYDINIIGVDFNNQETTLQTFTFAANNPEQKIFNYFLKNKYKKIKVTRPLYQDWNIGPINFYVSYI